jgi:gamma-glutamyltranspeptidase / glutathione hydrolase
MRDAASVLATAALPPDRAVAVSTHHLASQAAIDVMEAGGTAVDAAVAANAVVGVVLPDTCGIGGDLFALVHRPGDAAPAVLNASGRAGSGASSQRLRDLGHTAIPLRSVDSITVPGCVDGWEALIEGFGAHRLAELLEPAIAIAVEGFEVSAELATSLDWLQQMIGNQPSAASLYPHGRAPEAGDRLTRPDLARTLAAIAEGGRSAFYEGEPGAAITDVTGGIVTAEDLERVQADWVAPLGARILGLTAWTVPPNSQGWITLATLRIFELLDPPADPTDPAYHHALIEAYRSVVWERADLTCDPDTMPVAPDELLAPDRLASRAALVDPGKRQPWQVARAAPGGTTYLATRDGAGTTVSLIQSNFRGIGTGLSAGDTGVWLHDRGEGFDLRPGHPNELVPGRRPLHTLAPTLWTDAADAALVLGTRGGDQQPQYLAQFAANHRWAGLDLPAAQLAPRWAISIEEPDGVVRAESTFSPAALEGLAGRGHRVVEVPALQPGYGPVSAIGIGRGGVTGAADPRVSTTAALAT